MGDPSGRNPRKNFNGKGARKRPNSMLSVDSEESGMNDFDRDRLVETELDAAYALAEFAKLIHRDEGACLVQHWGAKRRRSRVRNSALQHAHAIKEECHPFDETSGSFPTSQEAGKVCIPDKEEPDSKPLNTYHQVHLGNAKFEPIYGTAKMEPKISRLFPCLRESRLRESMTEIEKEARRLRRVQANRESARQTIRRKQALLEELTQKAAQLAFENETMKQQTKLAMQEYNSLKDRNKQLKEQVSSNSKDLAHEVPIDSQVSEIQASKLQSMQMPLLHHNDIPLPPFLWKTAILPTSTATQAFVPENREAAVPMENNQFLTMYRQMAFNFWTIPSGNSQWHVSPFFLPCMPTFSQGVQSSSSHATESPSITTVACTSLGCQSGPSTIVKADVDNTLTEAEEKQMSRSADSNASNENEMLQESSSDRSLQNSNFETHTYTLGMPASHSPITITSGSTPLSNRQVTIQSGLPCNKAALNRMCSGYWNLLSKESNNPQIFPSSPNIAGNLPAWVQDDPWYLTKRLSVAVAASEARKRRKELTRNKSIQSRQLKLQS